MPQFLEGRRWYAGRDRALRATRLEDVIRIGRDAEPLFYAFVRVEYLDAAPELYALPLAWVRGETVPTGATVGAGDPGVTTASTEPAGAQAGAPEMTT